MEFWQFGRLVDTKVGLNPPIHYIRSPLNRSGSCGAEQATFQQTRSEAECFNGIGWQPIKTNCGGDWLEGTKFLTNTNSVELHPRSHNRNVMRNLEQ